ncbi:MAG: para-nitrobenzyl esterase PnbA [Ramlibacter sp.]|nr:para-nitrobenzyl esterase PnbA [Ramlibacter sp.]
MSEFATPSQVTVQLPQGALRGRRSGAGGVFLGVPFAAPPTGELRWRPPHPAASWTGVRDALAFSPDFPQPPGFPVRGPSQSEDALHLNIWTPQCEPGARLPVMVWVFGGGFSAGSGSDATTDGERLAAEGVVVVSINYRVGLFGFLAHPALSQESGHGVSGNYGLLDQMAAFAWIREHIAAFGGDPARITAFGVSAGSASLSLLLTAPAARGLFDQVILQSPGAGRPLANLPEAEQAGRALGDDLQALRALSADEILARTGLLAPKVRGLTSPRILRPIRDGRLLPQQEIDALKSGHFTPMPLMVGSNTDEGSSLVKAWPVDRLAGWQEQVQSNFGALASEAAATYPAATDAEARPRVAQMFADTQFNYGTRLLAQSMAAKEPRTWRYLFERRPVGQADGPHHTDELVYVFGNLPEGADAVDRELSAVMRKAWVAFAKTGDPGLPGWEAYRPAEDNYLAFGDQVKAGAGWRKPQLDFIDRYYRSAGFP